MAADEVFAAAVSGVCVVSLDLFSEALTVWADAVPDAGSAELLPLTKGITVNSVNIIAAAVTARHIDIINLLFIV